MRKERVGATLVAQQEASLFTDNASNIISLCTNAPIYFTDEMMNDLLKRLKKVNIVKFKPEFWTLSIQNLAWIGEMVRLIDKNMAKNLYELYIAPENITNVKHKNRMAPDRDFTHKAMMNLKKRADEYGLIMTLCHWVRSELNISQTEVPLIAREKWDRIS